MVLVIRDDKHYGSDGDRTSEEITTAVEEEKEKMCDGLGARLVNLHEEKQGGINGLFRDTGTVD